MYTKFFVLYSNRALYALLQSTDDNNNNNTQNGDAPNGKQMLSKSSSFRIAMLRHRSRQLVCLSHFYAEKMSLKRTSRAMNAIRTSSHHTSTHGRNNEGNFVGSDIGVDMDDMWWFISVCLQDATRVIMYHRILLQSRSITQELFKQASLDSHGSSKSYNNTGTALLLPTDGPQDGIRVPKKGGSSPITSRNRKERDMYDKVDRSIGNPPMLDGASLDLGTGTDTTLTIGRTNSNKSKSQRIPTPVPSFTEGARVEEAVPARAPQLRFPPRFPMAN